MSQLGTWLFAQDPWEATAVVLALAYLLLAVRESLWCWYAAFASTTIYLFLFWKVGLLMESALQVYYLGMAVYGWWQWHGDARQAGRVITTRRPGWHAIAAVTVIAAAAGSGWLLRRYTGEAMPYLDSFVTWGSLLATWMVAAKLLENWLWWFVIDSVSLYLYLERGLLLTALLFLAYLVIIVCGYRQWRRHFREQPAAGIG